eukprot:snap_masked-scaffold_10-processed-gene-6.25-mRNA-1 protein AED:1.00 eAED:1.00 QI:0/0/0/0/1/1/3/0/80
MLQYKIYILHDTLLLLSGDKNFNSILDLQSNIDAIKHKLRNIIVVQDKHVLVIYSQERTYCPRYKRNYLMQIYGRLPTSG